MPHELVDMDVTRRNFLKCTIGTAAACGLAQRSAANDASTESITDTHVYLGHWPHRQLPSDEPTKLVAELRRAGISQAWIGSFDGLFHKDIAGVNQRLVNTCTRIGDGMLIPFGTINPTLPDWEDDIRRCHETFHMPGIRLHPNYHGYKLDDPRFANLLELAAARGLVVQLVAWLEAETHFLLSPTLMRVDLTPLADKATPFSKLKLVVTNSSPLTDDESQHSLLPLKSIHFDFAQAENAKNVRVLLKKVSAERAVFGSGMPLHDIEPVVHKIQQAQLTDGDRHKIAKTNADRLVATTRAR